MAKIQNKIRADMSQNFGVLIPEGKWDQYFHMLDQDGHPNRKELLATILTYAQHIEQLENLVEDLYFQLGLLENKTVPLANNPEVKPEEPEVTLRTRESIVADLAKITTPQTNVYYLSERDWRIFEQSVSTELGKSNPEFGYGKEVDPKDYKEKTCLYYNGKPVFRKGS